MNDEVVIENEKQPSSFKQKREAEMLLKRAKKKAKKALIQRGHTNRDAKNMVKQALKTIARDNRPERKASNRGG